MADTKTVGPRSENARRDLTEAEERHLMLGHFVEIRYRAEQSIAALLAGAPIPGELILLRNDDDED
jgi:hypothetical protein